MIEIGSRRRALAAPAHVVWQSLTEPRRPAGRSWLALLDDEIEPTIVEAIEPVRVVWSSIWPSRPHDVIEFDIEPTGDGTALRWTVRTPAEPPDATRIGHIRYRMNVLINRELRYSYGQ